MNARAIDDRRIDFTEFDAMSVNFDLIIGAVQIDNGAVAASTG